MACGNALTAPIRMVRIKSKISGARGEEAKTAGYFNPAVGPFGLGPGWPIVNHLRELRSGTLVDDYLEYQRVECERCATEFLALNWGASQPKVSAIVGDMLAGGKLYSVSTLWLLHASRELSVREEPARRLDELIGAISTWRIRWAHRESFTLEQIHRDVA